jgi:choline dehydrogenase-like flavoprotein
MAEIQFAAGARAVFPMHENARAPRRWREARAMIEALPMRALAARVVSAHVMGGCAMGPDPRPRRGRRGVPPPTSSRTCRCHDGSIFPTSLGANPQLSIYAFTARASASLAAALGKPWPGVTAG